MKGLDESINKEPESSRESVCRYTGIHIDGGICGSVPPIPSVPTYAKSASGVPDRKTPHILITPNEKLGITYQDLMEGPPNDEFRLVSTRELKTMGAKYDGKSCEIYLTEGRKIPVGLILDESGIRCQGVVDMTYEAGYTVLGFYRTRDEKHEGLLLGLGPSITKKDLMKLTGLDSKTTASILVHLTKRGYLIQKR